MMFPNWKPLSGLCPIRSFSDRDTEELAKMPRLQDRLDEFKRVFESGAPPYSTSREAVESMHRATAELKGSGAEGRALKLGDTAPSFTLFNQGDGRVSSADIIRDEALVVSFFRGHW
jgi:hypothetical protein